MRISKVAFDDLLARIDPFIERQPGRHRVPIPNSTRLALTLKWLATGDCMATMSQMFCVGAFSLDCP
jgi:hypothetical protein